MSIKSFADVQDGLNHLSTFDLFRLTAMLDRKLEDADRILEVKRKLKIGQLVQYFIPENNRLAVGKLLKLQRRTALVEDQESGRHWDVIYPAIDLEVGTVQPYGDGVRLEDSDRFFQSGDDVIFLDRHNNEQIGKIIALNQKSATVVHKGTQWRIPYPSLTKIEKNADGAQDRSLPSEASTEVSTEMSTGEVRSTESVEARSEVVEPMMD